MPNVAFIMGTTCSGKSTFLDFAENLHPDRVGTINVGQMMRAKYPPEHFEGSAAPDHTEIEAWSMFTYALKGHIQAGKELILTDGQPRSHKQVQWAIHDLHEYLCVFDYVLFDCHKQERRRRLTNRFPNDPSSLELGEKRLTNDMVMYYVVLAELLKAKIPIRAIKTDGPFESYGPTLLEDLFDVR